MKIFVVGNGRTGTKTLSKMFERNYKSKHEPRCGDLMRALVEGKPVREVLDKIYEDEDLDLNSSGYNFWFLDEILDKFPEAKFIFTTRNTEDWLKSIYGHIMKLTFTTDIIPLFREYRFGKSEDWIYPIEEEILKKNNLPPLDLMLKYWKDRSEEVLKKIPSEKLFILNTKEINNSRKQLADFIGIEENTMDICHQNKSTKPFRLFYSIPPEYLDKKIKEYCTDERWGH